MRLEDRQIESHIRIFMKHVLLNDSSISIAAVVYEPSCGAVIKIALDREKESISTRPGREIALLSPFPSPKRL
jgi:hypothetical protein